MMSVFFVIQGCAAQVSVTLRRPGEATGQMRIFCSSIRTVDGRDDDDDFGIHSSSAYHYSDIMMLQVSHPVLVSTVADPLGYFLRC